MAANDHETYVYVGLAGEGGYEEEGGLYRYAVGEGAWESVARGLPEAPQVRALLIHPRNPSVLFAGTQQGLYRSADRGDHWEPLGTPSDGRVVWSLACHPENPDVLFAGYEPCGVERSKDGGASWERMDTEAVVWPHITTYMPPTAKRVLGIAVDPSNPGDVYAAIEVGGLLGSRDGGETWSSLIDGPYVRNNTLDLHAVAVSAAAPGTVYCAAQIGLFRGRDRAAHWEHVQVDEMFPGGSYCRDLAVAHDEPRVMYLAAGAGGGAAPSGTQEAGALFRSPDAGESWQRLDIGAVPPSRMAKIGLDPANPSFICCAAMRGQLSYSQDGGSSWQQAHVPVELSRGRHIYPMVCG
jgi:photosystem II stability/assembly factor-like uncharacterized protein